MLTIELDAGDQISVGQLDRIGALGGLAIEPGIERGACRPGLEPPGAGIGVGRNKAVAQNDLAPARATTIAIKIPQTKPLNVGSPEVGCQSAATATPWCRGRGKNSMRCL